MGKPFKVPKDRRTHPLSHSDGGCTVVVEYKDGKKLEYEDVKFPDHYIESVWRKDKLAQKIARVYVK